MRHQNSATTRSTRRTRFVAVQRRNSMARPRRRHQRTNHYSNAGSGTMKDPSNPSKPRTTPTDVAALGQSGNQTPRTTHRHHPSHHRQTHRLITRHHHDRGNQSHRHPRKRRHRRTHQTELRRSSVLTHKVHDYRCDSQQTPAKRSKEVTK